MVDDHLRMAHKSLANGFAVKLNIEAGLSDALLYLHHVDVATELAKGLRIDEGLEDALRRRPDRPVDRTRQFYEEPVATTIHDDEEQGA